MVCMKICTLENLIALTKGSLTVVNIFAKTL